ncbi:MAG: glycosyltransferase, partial [Acidimicrobiia bacterium]
MPAEQFTVVIPVHNEAAFLTTALARLADQLADLEFRLILVENGSTDGTLKIARDLQTAYPWLEVTNLEK